MDKVLWVDVFTAWADVNIDIIKIHFLTAVADSVTKMSEIITFKVAV